MKAFIFYIFLFISIISCKPKNINASDNANHFDSDTIKIANKDLEYEVIIIDAGFSSWLNSRAFPRGYHSESFLENKNIFYVNEWNNRAMQPSIYDPNLYEMQINYQNNIHYGYEVNYLIYNYMIYFQNTYNQKLFGFVPPR
jgi:hypothetical protein